MGRAIDVDNRLDVVEARLKKTEKLVDVVLDILEQQAKEEEVEEKETNNEGNGESSVKSNKRKTDAISKNRKS